MSDAFERIFGKAPGLVSPNPIRAPDRTWITLEPGRLDLAARQAAALRVRVCIRGGLAVRIGRAARAGLADGVDRPDDQAVIRPSPRTWIPL